MLNTDLNQIIINDIRNNGLYPHYLESMNEFYTHGLNEILVRIFHIEKNVANQRTETELDRQINTIKFEVIFRKVSIEKPFYNGKIVYPKECRAQDRSYLGTVYADVTIKATAFLHSGEKKVKEANVDNHLIAEMPIMIGSNMCNTHGMSKEALELIGEDPADPQGIFIINGSEWIINNLIARKYNLWYSFHNEYNKEHARAEFISVPGDSFENSSEIIMRYMMTGELNIRLTSDRYFREMEIPFYVIFKLLGMPNERAIIDTIVPEGTSQTGDAIPKMREILSKACLVKYDSDLRNVTDYSNLVHALIYELAIRYVAKKGIVNIDEKRKHIENEQKILKELLMINLDNNLFPHIGKAPEHRFEKALQLCLGIRKMLYCYFDIIPSTDRDSNEMKRVQPTGDSFSKMIKKEVNSSIVNSLRSILDEIAVKNSFDEYELAAAFKIGCKAGALKTRIISNLNTGMSTKIIDGQKVKNRMPSENLKRKNNAFLVNAPTIQRSISSQQVFSNERAHEIREVQPSYAHTTCMVQTAEGTPCGLVQNTTFGTKISTASSSEIMMNLLLEDAEVIPWKKIMGISEMTRVLVNGRWIGYCQKPSVLYKKYRNYRRTGELIGLDRMMTICWDNIQKEIDFRTDRGRALSPFIIVYNNLTEHGAKKLGVKMCNPLTGEGFVQDILVTQEHIQKLLLNEIKTADLFNEGFIDYIAPEELKQVLCAETLEILHDNSTNVYCLYTHLCIPATLLSITSSLTPFMHNGPPNRVSLAGNHLRQACGLYAANYHQRFDKQGYVQSHNQFPLVYTISNHFMSGMGQNTIIAVTTWDGYNIEDSLCLNLSAAQRGAYYVTKYTYIKITLEKDEEFVVPNENITDNINRYANYSKLVGTHVEVGTRIDPFDVLVSKVSRYPNVKINGVIYRDRSEIWDETETAYVSGVETGVDGDMNQFIKIRLEIPREFGKGQKMASRNGQKGMTAIDMCQSDFPFTKNGIIPTLLLNPHAFPSRQTLNQLMEGLYSKLAVKNGCVYEGSFTIKTDIDHIGNELEKLGYHRNGTEVMFNGRTGRMINTTVFISPIYQCRLQKFSEEEAYAVGDSGQLSFTTRQPIPGRARDGGIRLGEMEKDCLGSHGAMRYFTVKAAHDCDGISIYLCRRCGYRAVGNPRKKISECKFCGPLAEIVKFPTRFSAHLVLNIFEAMGVKIKFVTEPYKLLI